ncbi:MAG TPA: phosphate ABC transporter substrate-binding protein [Candidatus Kapabacteria bacterium]|nr:phosphate ABC transporter substrate-binding protein [Candidatus Kapabacteria bacterium]
MKNILTNGIAVMLSALVAFGCGGGAKKKESAEADGSGKQVVTEKGSDTMVLLAQAWAEAFGSKHADIQVQVTGGGSGTGIAALIGGTTDIANASRPMSPEERAQIKQKFGSDVLEIPVAKDGIGIYVNPDNPVQSLTTEQLRGIYSGTITDWKDVGGKPGAIILYGRENSSGTYVFFKEHVLNKGDFAKNTQALPGTAAIVNSVSKDKAGIGYGGEAYAKGVKVLGIAGADGKAVTLSEETVRSGAYPLSRSLFFYLRQAPSGGVKTYLDWVLSPEGQAVVKKAGYYPIAAGA